ncbi:MAG: DUF3343 domain-containing protein [Clostridia bacterium]|nr:DUF3343 domain-containing protein [Clostridia bacterium]
MKYGIFALSSLTYAYKGRDALYRYDIRSTVIRLDGTETKKGCRFGLRVDERDRDEARRALRSAGIVFTET